ncbi:MAG: 3-methyl-2-oxobutanoate hydroxymethyltransferase [bacterium]|nr:3-methyl-2-oxobutanoate hydroxymethyltransferase [bacterium]
MSKVTISTLHAKKQNKEKITALTAYDAPTARLLDESGIDIILVGDSLGNTFAGHDNSLPVTTDQIIYHCQAVRRGCNHALILGDMPFMSYQVSVEDAIRNAGRIIKEGGAHAIKMEVGVAHVDHVSSVVNAGIPVIAHIGFTPQAIHQIGGFKVQGKGEAAAQELINLAHQMELAGAAGLLLEMVPAQVSKTITDALRIPTIGIGAGPHTDGQILVTNDVLGYKSEFSPKFVKRYASIETVISDAFKSYVSEIKSQTFPKDEHSY